MPKGFITRLKAGLRPDLTSLVRFIEEETKINLKNYSFAGHEYQKYFCELIERDPNVDITAEKCSQIGLSEICFRIVLAKMALTPGYNVIYAMPSKTFAMEVLKTRIAPIIDQSSTLSSLITREVDSASVKMFNNGSTLFALGASANSSASLINRPVTLALTDELDKCDKKVHSGLRSRQTHSHHGKPVIAVSTPTAPGVGINGEAEGRQLHYQIVVCCWCGHEFVPDYYTQIELPGYTDPIATLTKEKIRELDLDTDTAFHFCPDCHKTPNLAPPFRRWVIENKKFNRIHLRLTPFDAPTFITPPDLVRSQLYYESRAEFDNQSLGLPSQLSDSSISIQDIKFTRDDCPSGLPIAGLDLGKINYLLKGNLLSNGSIFVDHVETIPVGELESRVNYIIRKFNVISMVSDSLPFLDLIHKLTQTNPIFWGAIYSVPRQPQPELYKLKIRDDEGVRQVNIQRDMMMDHVAGMIATEQIVFKNGAFDEILTQHIGNMRRIRDHRFSEMRYMWQKPKNLQDHFWHSLVYLVAASKLIQKTNTLGVMPTNMVSSFKAKIDL